MFINFLKVKHGKLTLKIKQLQNRKSASPEEDSLDKAILDELNQRAKEAEKGLKEAEKTIENLTLEKKKFIERIDTLEGGNDRYFELKEDQDRQVHLLKSIQQDLQNQIVALEWQISDKDQQISNFGDGLLLQSRVEELENLLKKSDSDKEDLKEQLIQGSIHKPHGQLRS